MTNWDYFSEQSILSVFYLAINVRYQTQLHANSQTSILSTERYNCNLNIFLSFIFLVKTKQTPSDMAAAKSQETYRE